MALDRRLITQLREADNITARRLTRKSLDWQLTDEQLAKLDEATKIELGFPHDFLTNDSSGRWCSVEHTPPSIIIAAEAPALRDR